jgi:hypothetical protein
MNMHKALFAAVALACATACSGGSTTSHSDPLTAGPGIRIDPATQAIGVDESKVPMMPSCAAGQIVRRGATGWECGASAPDSAQLGGKPAAAYLTTDATASNASNLEGHPASFFLGATAQAADSLKLGGADAASYLKTTGVAADSAKLGGAAASAYQRAADPAATALNALKLNGKADTAFLAATGQAVDSARLGGVDAASYLKTTGLAADAAKLGGAPAASFTRSDVAQTMKGPLTVTNGAVSVVLRGDELGGVFGSNSAGNLHLDANSAKADGQIYLNWATGKGTVFGNGNLAAPDRVASIDKAGNVHAKGDLGIDGDGDFKGNVQAGSFNGFSITVRNAGSTRASCDAVCAEFKTGCLAAKRDGQMAACSSSLIIFAQPTVCACSQL